MKSVRIGKIHNFRYVYDFQKNVTTYSLLRYLIVAAVDDTDLYLMSIYLPIVDYLMWKTVSSEVINKNKIGENLFFKNVFN